MVVFPVSKNRVSRGPPGHIQVWLKNENKNTMTISNKNQQSLPWCDLCSVYYSLNNRFLMAHKSGKMGNTNENLFRKNSQSHFKTGLNFFFQRI